MKWADFLRLVAVVYYCFRPSLYRVKLVIVLVLKYSYFDSEPLKANATERFFPDFYATRVIVYRRPVTTPQLIILDQE